MPHKKIEKIIHENKSNQIILRLTSIERNLIKNGRNKERFSWLTSSQAISEAYYLWIRSCNEKSIGGLVEGTIERGNLGGIRL